MASPWDSISYIYIWNNIDIYYIVWCVVDSASQFFAKMYMMETGVLYGQRFSQERLPENSNSFENYVVCLRQQAFSGSILPEHTFKGQYMGNRWNAETAIIIHEPLGIWLTRIWRFPGVYLEPAGYIWLSNDDYIRLISCNWYAACRYFQCSCSTAELCCTKVCWCEGDVKCVNPSTISAHAPDID